MSLRGRHHFRGDPVHVYRAAKSEGSGGQVARTWTRQTPTPVKLELMTTTAELGRRFWGEESAIEATTLVAPSLDIRLNDVLIVLEGPLQYRRLMVAGARTLGRGLRQIVELALEASPETIDADIELPEAA